MKKLGRIFILFWLVSGCRVSPKPIDYGKEACRYCMMTIVDKLHAAEIVTKKGKVYKFDSTECMINFLKDFNNSEIKFYLSNDYTNPEKLIDASKATFLISEHIPSPMGAFLSAFNNKKDALKIQIEKGGTIYNWEEILLNLKK